MRVVLQRVSSASVSVDGKQLSSIGKGYLILLGVGQDDGAEDLQWLLQKIVKLRLFSDEEGKMNLSLQDIQGQALVISQFTLHAASKKGTRPSFIKAGAPAMAEQMYQDFCKGLAEILGEQRVGQGQFGADMQVELVNDGPVTLWLDTKNKE